MNTIYVFFGSAPSSLQELLNLKLTVEWSIQERFIKGAEAESLVLSIIAEKIGTENVLPVKFPETLSKYNFGADYQIKRDLEAWIGNKYDAVIKMGKITCLADVKFKSFFYPVVNISDYDIYFKLSRFLPFRIFFYMERRIYVHDVRDPSNPQMTTQMEKDGNMTYRIPNDELSIYHVMGKEE